MNALTVRSWWPSRSKMNCQKVSGSSSAAAEPRRRVGEPRQGVEVSVVGEVAERERVAVLGAEGRSLRAEDARGERVELGELGGSELPPPARVPPRRDDDPSAQRRRREE